MKRSLLNFTVPAFSLLAFLLAGCAQTAETNTYLDEVATEFNKKCPQIVDSETRIDGINVKPPSTLVYKYTLINLPVENVDTTEFKKMLLPGLVSMIRLSPDLKPLRENNTLFEYSYSDKANKHIYTFKISPKDYNP